MKKLYMNRSFIFLFALLGFSLLSFGLLREVDARGGGRGGGGRGGAQHSRNVVHRGGSGSVNHKSSHSRKSQGVDRRGGDRRDVNRRGVDRQGGDRRGVSNHGGDRQRVQKERHDERHDRYDDRRDYRKDRLKTAAIVGTARALTAGTRVYTLPAGCTVIDTGGVAYQFCGNTFYRPYYEGTQITYVVVNSPI